MLKNKFIILVLTFLSLAWGKGNSPTAFLDVKLGPFRPAIGNYSQVYDQVKPMGTVKFGLGFKNNFLVAGYRTFTDHGVSKVDGVDINGVADWEEQIASYPG